MTVQFDEDKQRLKIDDLRKQEEEGLADAMSAKFGIPYVDLNSNPINIDALRLISEAEAREAMCVVFNEVDKVASVGVLSPQNTHTRWPQHLVTGKCKKITPKLINIDGHMRNGLCCVDDGNSIR